MEHLQLSEQFEIINNQASLEGKTEIRTPCAKFDNKRNNTKWHYTRNLPFIKGLWNFENKKIQNQQDTLQVMVSFLQCQLTAFYQRPRMKVQDSAEEQSPQKKPTLATFTSQFPHTNQ